MDLNWLALIIPASYYLISLLFLCFPNILHKRAKYSSQIFNSLVDGDKLLCIGHRGGAFEGPQNTMELFRKNADNLHMFELDVCYTKDGQLVVNHDINLNRTCGKNIDITTLNYEQLPPFQEEYESFGGGGLIKTIKNKIPLLEQLFKQFPETIMNIQLKTPSDESIKQFSRLVRKYGREHITVWGAVNDEMNDNLRDSLPQTVNFYSAFETLKIFLLCIFGLLPFVCIRQGVLDIPLITDAFADMAYKFAGSGCKKCLVCFFVLVLKFFNLISRLFIPHLKKRGILTFYFILNEEEDFETAISMGCSGIMTDSVRKLNHFLKQKDLYFERLSDTF